MPKPFNVLLVDDSATTRSMIKRVIGMLDLPAVKVSEAANGRQGLDRLKESAFDLVLADLNMPVMDGFEMIERLRQDPATRSLRVVVISAQPDPAQVRRLEAFGIAGYLAKPFTAEALRDMIVPAAGQPRDPLDGFNLTLAEALAEALQTMAFINSDLTPDAKLPRDTDGLRLVSVDFRGTDTQGSLSLAASPRLGRAIAGTLDADAPDAEDALKELANVTCGLLLRMRPGGGAGFRLDPPALRNAAETDARKLFDSDDVISLTADEHVVAARVITDTAFYGA